MPNEKNPEQENEISTPETTSDPDPDITAPEVDYLINTFNPEKEGGVTILNEKVKR